MVKRPSSRASGRSRITLVAASTSRLERSTASFRSASVIAMYLVWLMSEVRSITFSGAGVRFGGDAS